MKAEYISITCQIIGAASMLWGRIKGIGYKIRPFKKTLLTSQDRQKFCLVSILTVLTIQVLASNPPTVSERPPALGTFDRDDGITYTFISDQTCDTNLITDVNVRGVSPVDFSGLLSIPSSFGYYRPCSTSSGSPCRESPDPEAFNIYEKNTYKVTAIGIDAFKGWKRVTKVALPSTVRVILGGAFQDCESLASISIPDSVYYLGNGVFRGCSNLQTVEFGRGCGYGWASGGHIDSYAFQNCTRLMSLSFPDRVTKIGKQAFDGCSNLRSVTFGDSLQRIDGWAFKDCKNLTSITFLGDAPDVKETLMEKIFYNGPDSCVITVSKGTRGWDDDGDGKWQGYPLRYVDPPAKTYTLRLHRRYDDFDSAMAIRTLTVGGKWRALPTVAELGWARDYYTFLGWSLKYIDARFVKYADGARVKDLSVIRGDTVHLYAVWKKNHYTLRLHRNNSKNDGATAVRTGYEMDIPCALPKIKETLKWAPRTGYDFLGWATSATATKAQYRDAQKVQGLSTTPDATVHLYAVWKTQSYIVRLHRNNSENDGATASRSYAVGKGRALPTVQTELKWAPRNGYTFKGWATRADATTVQYSDGQTISPGKAGGMVVHLYAIWECHPRHVMELYRNNSSRDGAMARRTVTEDTYYTLPTVASLGWMRSGYTFQHWTDNLDSGSVTYGDGARIYVDSGLHSLHAVWKSDSTHVMTLNRNNSVGDGAMARRTVPDNGYYTLPTIAALKWIRSGYTFKGWATSRGGTVRYGDGARIYMDPRMVSLYAVWGTVVERGKVRFFIENGGLTSVELNGEKSVTIPSSVTSIGEGAFWYCSGLTSVTIPDGVTSIGNRAFGGCSGLTSVTIPDRVTSIGNRAFAGCSGLTSVTIPSSVTSIGDSAFYGCTSVTDLTASFVPDGMDKSKLMHVTIPDGVTSIGNWAFHGCDNLTGVTMPDSVTSIGNWAFYGCDNLTGVTMPDSVTSIGDGAFEYCSSLTSVTIPSSVTSIGNRAFAGCSGLTSVTIPDRVTSIGDAAFYKCSGLASVTIGNGVKSIGGLAFAGCSGLASVTIPSSVTSIGQQAFSGCSGLTSVTIGNGVTSIGEAAFEYCSSLTSVTIPSSVTSIGGGAFYGCTNLTSVTIPSSVTSIGGGAFAGCSGLTSVTIPSSMTSIGGGAFSGCSGLTSVTIPSSVTSIGNYAFYGCSGLTSVTIPSSVTSIGGDAFVGCTRATELIAQFCPPGLHGIITHVTIPDGVTRIGDWAFSDCRGLTSVTIPSSVTSIGGRAFAGCSGLTSVTIPSSVTDIASDAFEDCPFQP